jgi:uncharacterized protein (TIGR00369 family)
MTPNEELLLRLRARFEHSPAQQLLGIELRSLAADEAEVRLPFHPRVDNGGGSVHGGLLALLADSAVACALATSFDGRMGFATANLNIHYLRRAKSSVTARARIVKKGATICVGQVEIHDEEGRLVATASSDFVLTTSRLPGAEEPLRRD